MGTIIDHAIIVTGDRGSVAKAHAKAVEIFPDVTSVADSMNHSASFLVPPDGSKLGWSESELGCRRRHELTLIASITIRPSAKAIADFESVQRLNAAMVSERLAANAMRRGDLLLEWATMPLALVLGLAIGWLW